MSFEIPADETAKPEACWMHVWYPQHVCDHVCAQVPCSVCSARRS